jgi:hypothetical protein
MALASLLLLHTIPQTPAGSVAAWTVRLNGDIRWQQITPAGALLVSTDGALAGVDIEKGQIAWQKPSWAAFPIASAPSKARC